MNQADIDLLSTKYKDDGYCIIERFDGGLVERLSAAVYDQISSIIPESISTRFRQNVIKYHEWFDEADHSILHDDIFTASARHFSPSQCEFGSMGEDKQVTKMIENIVSADNIKVWDEGLGWCAFRLIRPLPFKDGYPLSKKEWGPGGNLISLYIPIALGSRHDNFGIVPKSHARKFQGEKQPDKFCRDELRLTQGQIDEAEIVRPDVRLGQGLLFSPKLIHCEAASANSTGTRLSCEIRFKVGS